VIRGLLSIAVFEGLPLVVVGTTTYALATARGWMSVRERMLLSIAVALGVVSRVGAYGPDWLLQVVFSFAPGFVLIGGAAFIVASMSGNDVASSRRSCRSDDIAYDMISECLGALFSTRMSLSRQFAVTVVRREYS
jgi:hypothetical protein